MTDISPHFEKAKAKLKAERDLMAQHVREEIAQSKRKVLSKV